MGDSTKGDAIWGFETEIPDRKPANLGEAGGTHGNGLFGRPADGARPSWWLPRGPDTGEGSGLEPRPWFDRAAVSPEGVAQQIGAGRQSGGWDGDGWSRTVRSAEHGTQGVVLCGTHWWARSR